MKSLFGGLDQFGMDDIDNLDLFEDEELKDQAEKKEKKEVQKELLYDRSVRCPVCNTKFMARTVKSGSAKLEDTGITLRPIYSGIDPILYDVVSCEHCGYTALNRNYNKISERQSCIIREKVSSKFVSVKAPQTYDYEIALARYKMALYCDVVIARNDVNKAYLCLKITWLLDEVIANTEEEATRMTLIAEKKAFTSNAFKGFNKAYDKVVFPVFGMNESTYRYLLGSLAYQLGDMKTTGFWLGKILMSTNGNKRVKDKARELKNLIDQDKKLRD